MGQPINSIECSEAAGSVTRESEVVRLLSLLRPVRQDSSARHSGAHAWAQCRSNRGAPGVDRQDFADIKAYGVERWLAELALSLRKETYRPDPIRRVFILKPNGKLRPLGISTLRDRVCMTAAMLVLEPIFEADLPPAQYAYRRAPMPSRQQ
jgi:retron-type reverse transcriptase